ncbi:nitrogen regulatory protein P-II family [Desulfocurvibacter africanus PCS]|uniref:Nitrogen regulatory protein P-II family n=1 Tax=Desulfocurvibacter africanus PCS TaxID=1262666 RepID=M5PVX0_DESAF|nr:P-II family nitrogen regulator [Desulfocurvibacter africanus]EMG38219.1 nitrogen regulatory protein P-II family [Desulfocurvibacter africanus PCS]
MKLQTNRDLIVTIVNKGWSERVVKSSKAAGAEGGTILFARGTGVRERTSFLGISVEPEKEMVLTIVSNKITETVLQAIVDGAELEKPGAGIAFVLPLKSVAGICHFEPEATSLDNVICD